MILRRMKIETIESTIFYARNAALNITEVIDSIGICGFILKNGLVVERAEYKYEVKIWG